LVTGEPASPYSFLLDIPHVWTEGVDLDLWREAKDGYSFWDFAGQMEFLPIHQVFWSLHVS
jgi:hypothetical protein